MSKDLQKAKVGELAAFTPSDMSEWNDVPVQTSDVVIPKVLLQQPISPAVADGKAKNGDWLLMGQQRVLGGLDKPVEVIPFHLERIWVVFKKVGLEWEYDHIAAVGPVGDKLEWEWEENKVQYRRDYCMNFFCLLANELDSLPVVVPFKRTSSRPGKELYTQMYVTNRAAGLPPCGKTIMLGSKKVTEPQKVYAVATVNVGRTVMQAEYDKALQWKKTFATTKVRTDDSDLTAEKHSEPPVFKENEF